MYQSRGKGGRLLQSTAGEDKIIEFLVMGLFEVTKEKEGRKGKVSIRPEAEAQQGRADCFSSCAPLQSKNLGTLKCYA
jgi:hypothetical protein